MDCPSIVAMMGKKGTFISATQKLSELITTKYGETDEKGKDEMFNACKRVFSLLRSRYTAVGFWRAGKVLADAALLAMENETKRCPAVREWLAMAAAELIYWDAVSGVDQAGGAADPNNPPEEQARAAQSVGSEAPRPMENLARDLGFEAFLGSVIAEMDIEEMLSRIAEWQGEADSPSLASIFPSMGMGSSTPAASREARFNLDVKTIREQGAVCLICHEDFPPKSKAKIMPCGHPFHYECLMEWLERNNTCPTCRHALPTERPTFDLESDRVAARDPARSSLYI